MKHPRTHTPHEGPYYGWALREMKDHEPEFRRWRRYCWVLLALVLLFWLVVFLLFAIGSSIQPAIDDALILGTPARVRPAYLAFVPTDLLCIAAGVPQSMEIS